MKQQDRLDEGEVVAQLTVLQDMPPRNALHASKEKAAFLTMAVSLAEQRRHKGWIASLFVRKETHRMPALATIALVLALVFGGAGLTGVAVQNALPDQALYQVKIMSEEMRYGLTSDASARWQMMLAFSEQRAIEIRTMVRNGTVPSDAVLARYQTQVEQALDQSLQLADDQAILALEQIQTQLQIQEELLSETRSQVGTPQGVAMLARTQTMLRERIDWVEQGIDSPQTLRDGILQRDRDRLSAPSVQPTDKPDTPNQGRHGQEASGTPDGSCGNCTPTGVSRNPWTDDTSTPGSGYGPGTGPEPTRTCTAQDGPNPNPGNTAQPEHGAQPSKTVDPGYGPNPTEKPGQGSQSTMTPDPGNQLNPTAQSGPGPQATLTPNPGNPANPTDRPGNNGAPRN
jgi:hypothetical protein